MMFMKRRKIKNGEISGKIARSAAKVFGTALVTTALVFGVPGCKRDVSGDEKRDRMELQYEKERKDAFRKHLENKLGHAIDVYDIKYPEGFEEMLRFPFDKSDSITYNFSFRNVNSKEVHEIVRALVEGLDSYYAERKMPDIKDDKEFECWYVTELDSVNYERKDKAGTLGIGVQFEKIEKEVEQKKKKGRKNGK